MNKQLWKMYKQSPDGKACIDLFNPEVENISDGAFAIWKYSSKWGADPVEGNFREEIDRFLWLWGTNLSQRGLIPDKWDRESFRIFVKEYDILRPKCDNKGEIEYTNDNQVVLEEGSYVLKKEQYREKAASISFFSLLLYYSFEFFKPILLPKRFDVIQRNCNALGISLPTIPRSNDYKEYLDYYFDLCESLNTFQQENELTDAELCACIYDFANLLIEESKDTTLPKPTNVWLTGAGVGDFAFLDSLGIAPQGNKRAIWACNERTRRGDIVVVYCTSPRSYIHSIWRSDSGGFFNPFDYYHCRTTVRDGIKVPPLSFKDLKEDSHMSQIPIVRRNLQGINGIELTSENYAALLRMIRKKGGDSTQLPQLFEGVNVDFGEIKLEKDVEENILIPTLKKLGYSDSDWTRQLLLKAGRKEKAIPDFVFFPRGKEHFETAPMIIEAKLDMAPVQELQKAFEQGWSYAKLLRSTFMGICDKERLVLYKADSNGFFDRNNPIFENHWAAIFADSNIGAQLAKLIGREVIKGI